MRYIKFAGSFLFAAALLALIWAFKPSLLLEMDE